MPDDRDFPHHQFLRLTDSLSRLTSHVFSENKPGDVVVTKQKSP